MEKGLEKLKLFYKKLKDMSPEEFNKIYKEVKEDERNRDVLLKELQNLLS